MKTNEVYRFGQKLKNILKVKDGGVKLGKVQWGNWEIFS